ncbi:MAG TPA: serine/threonine protein kinase, partial [Planctomycetes bacterium]|nr:serine/threonine protein kinase [Planctomycetota bacterium]
MTDSNQTEVQDEDEREGARQLSLQGNDPPSEIEGYSVIRRLGTGAYGTVWLAREDRTGRMVAIKYYPHRRGLNWSLLNREVEKLATLYASRNIVRLLDVGWNAEPPYYVMEYVENGSLGAYLASGALDVSEAVRITQQVCGALIEAHGAGVLHCDLKPDNILLDAQFQVRLCDFGQSRMSHEQSPALGTLYYMAPEQADLEAIPDARWDVYAVGALLYHMLTGQPPYREQLIQKKLEQAESLQTRLTIYRDHIAAVPAPRGHHAVRGVDSQLASIVDRCLTVDPKMRLPNAQAILEKLKTRDRNRSRRPLLLLGVLGPILLLTAMVPIFLNTLQNNFRIMEDQLITDAKERNALTARIQADSLRDELEDRLDELKRVVQNEEIVLLLTDLAARSADDVVAEMKEYHDAAMEDRPEWMRRLDAARTAADEQNEARQKSKDTSWFLTDARGTQIWRRNFSDRTIGVNYAWRDYFHGTNTQYQKGATPDGIQPLQEGHVSLAFISEVTKQYMVALSVPVRSTDGQVIGVFARTAHLGDLQRHLGKDIQSRDFEANLQVALADTREGQLLDHPWLTPDILLNRSGEAARKTFQRLRMHDDIRQQIEAALSQPEQPLSAVDADGLGSRRLDFRTDSYKDPVGLLVDEASTRRYAGDWIAAMSPMKSKKMPWLVIVQEKKEEALRPVRSMEKRATRQVW